MGKKKHEKASQLKAGEIIEIESLIEMTPSGRYRVERVDGDFIRLSAGTMTAGIHKDYIQVKARNLSEPVSWEKREIEILEAQACHCVDCRALLFKRQRLKMRINGEAEGVQKERRRHSD